MPGGQYGCGVPDEPDDRAAAAGVTGAVGKADDPDEAATVEELTHRLDVKARTKEKVRATPMSVRIGAGAALVGFVGLLVWRHRGRA